MGQGSTRNNNRNYCTNPLRLVNDLLLAEKKAVVLIENIICFDSENFSFPEL
jgi:hypothetical protein